MIQPTSLEAYEVIKPTLGYRQTYVYEHIQQHPDCCNHDIAHGIGLEINCITPRVKELRDKGLIICSGHKIDLSTNRRVMTWRAIQ